MRKPLNSKPYYNQIAEPIFKVIKSRNRSGQKNSKRKDQNDTFDYFNESVCSKTLSTQIATYNNCFNNNEASMIH